jgi:hypothetical protein
LLSKNIKIKIQRNIILHVVLLYGCETAFLTLREKRRLRMSAYKVLRKTLWHEGDEVRVKSKRLHNEELRDTYFSPNAIQVIKSKRKSWAERVLLMGDRRGACSVSVGKCEIKRKLRRPRLRRVASTKMGVQEIEWGCGLD